MATLLEKMLKAGGIKETAVMGKSKFFVEKDTIHTDLPILNIAFSGKLDGGLVPGITVLAGESKSFKTLLSLYCLKAYFDKYPDAVCLFYDSEFGSTPEYFEMFDIDPMRVVHIPIKHVEELKFDIVDRLEKIDRGDRVFIMLDSLGALASKKEVEDAENEKSVADMTRAKAIRSLLRIITPHVTMKDLPCLIINHIYKTMEMFSKTVIPGGCLLPGTKIILEDGSLKNIEDVLVGDMVKTFGASQMVSHVWNPHTLLDGFPECYKITYEDGYSVECSDGHKFLIGDDWVVAKDLNVGDKVTTIKYGDLAVESVEPIGRHEVYDITVPNGNNYVLENGVVSHNTAVTYAANQIFVISKSQEKDGSDLAGYKFTINIEKSRFVREKAKLPFTVLYETGVNKWSSLFELALESGHIQKATQGWYNRIDLETGEIITPNQRAKDIGKDDEFFKRLIKTEGFMAFVEEKFKLNALSPVDGEPEIEDTEE